MNATKWLAKNDLSKSTGLGAVVGGVLGGGYVGNEVEKTQREDLYPTHRAGTWHPCPGRW